MTPKDRFLTSAVWIVCISAIACSVVAQNIGAAEVNAAAGAELARHEQLPVTAVKLTDWEPSKFATFSHSSDVDDVAIFIDAYLARVCLSGYENYALNVTLQNLS